jgi:aminocarboxymuconate-semialdehyde decarboxylase
MHARMDRAQQGDVAKDKPSAYLKRFYYDTIVHDPAILSWLINRVSAERVALGTDYSFPPADTDPLSTVRAAGLTDAQVKAICEDTPRALFPLLPA